MSPHTKPLTACRCLLQGLIFLACACCVPLSFASDQEDFFSAVIQDNTRTVEQLLHKGFAFNEPNAQGEYALMVALRAGAFQVVDRLLAQPNIRVEVRNAQDESPLMLVALKGQLALCEKMLALDADANKPGWTPLHYAATGGHTDVIALLLNHHAYIDAESPNGSTPLMMAVMYGTSAAVTALLEAGADPEVKNQKGLSALDFARIADRPSAQELIVAAIRARRPKGTW